MCVSDRERERHLVLLEVLFLQVFPLLDFLLQELQPDLCFAVVLLQLLGRGRRLTHTHTHIDKERKIISVQEGVNSAGEVGEREVNLV